MANDGVRNPVKNLRCAQNRIHIILWPIVRGYIDIYIFIHTPYNVGHGPDEQVGTALLHAAAIGVVVHVPHGLPGAQTAQYEILAVGVDHVHELGVRRVQPGLGVLVLEQRPGRVQACDPAQILEFGAGVAGRVRAQTETYQVHVLDRQVGLGRQSRYEHGHLFADQPGVGRGPHVVGYYGAGLPVHADDVAVDLRGNTDGG